MISATNRRRNDLAKAAVDRSSLNADAKADLDELLDGALETTNGLEPAEKLERMAETLYQLTRLTCIHIAERPRPATWRDVVIACRREIAAIALALLVLLALRPQIVQVVERLVRP